MKYITLINPEAKEDLIKYCNEQKGIITKCYGFGKDYCPKTCKYARTKMVSVKTGLERFNDRYPNYRNDWNDNNIGIGAIVNI